MSGSGEATPGAATGLAIGPTRRVRPFAFATFMLDARRLGADPAAQYWNVVASYAWHAADVLAFVNATDTLQWNQPVLYKASYSRRS